MGGWNRNPLTEEDRTRASRLIETALELGINLFDHADIYCYGKSEEVFGQVLRQKPK